MNNLTPEDIDSLLPQTQCGLCNYGGCMPYAEALLYENAPINRCPPGGVNTLVDLADLLNKDVTPYLTEMQEIEKLPSVVAIRESECIGCTKCIQVCPVDAIVGAAKLMHTIITEACTGCDLCIPACPVDCIDILTIEARSKSDEADFRNDSRARFNKHKLRLQQEELLKKNKNQTFSLQQKKAYITSALERIKMKKII